MNLSPIYLQRLEAARQEGRQEAIQAERRAMIENLMRVRFGEIDNALLAIVEPMLELPPEEFTVLLLQLSREELLVRFGGVKLRRKRALCCKQQRNALALC